MRRVVGKEGGRKDSQDAEGSGKSSGGGVGCWRSGQRREREWCRSGVEVEW